MPKPVNEFLKIREEQAKARAENRQGWFIGDDVLAGNAVPEVVDREALKAAELIKEQQERHEALMKAIEAAAAVKPEAPIVNGADIVFDRDPNPWVNARVKQMLHEEPDDAIWRRPPPNRFDFGEKDHPFDVPIPRMHPRKKDRGFDRLDYEMVPFGNPFMHCAEDSVGGFLDMKADQGDRDAKLAVNCIKNMHERDAARCNLDLDARDIDGMLTWGEERNLGTGNFWSFANMHFENEIDNYLDGFGEDDGW